MLKLVDNTDTPKQSEKVSTKHPAPQTSSPCTSINYLQNSQKWVHFAEPLLIDYIPAVKDVPDLYPELDPQDREANEDIFPYILLPEYREVVIKESMQDKEF